MQRVRDLHVYLGKELEAKVLEPDKNRNNVVLSRRAWLEEIQSEVRHTFLASLLKGQARSGVVSSIVSFGVFVDLGGVEGLAHVSELSWKHVDHPAGVVDIDLRRRRISLSLKQADAGLTGDPTVDQFDPTLCGMGLVRRRGRIHLPGRLRRRGGGVARGPRRRTRGLGDAVRRGAQALRAASAADRRSGEGRRGAGGRGVRGRVSAAPRRGPWPRIRHGPEYPCRIRAGGHVRGLCSPHRRRVPGQEAIFQSWQELFKACHSSTFVPFAVPQSTASRTMPLFTLTRE